MVTYNIVFAAAGLTKDGLGLISIMIRFSSDVRKKIGTGIYVLPEEWDDENSRVIKNKLSIKYNAEITKKLSEIKELEVKLFSLGRKFTREELDNYLAGDRSNDIFNEFILSQIRAESGLKLSTVKDKMKTYRAVCSFMPVTKFSDLNYGWVQAFNSWLTKRGYSPSTIYNYHKNVKKYMSLAINHELLDKNPYARYKLTQPSIHKDYLSILEIDNIYNKEYDNERLRRAADLFVFQCTTALRVSDLMKLDASMLEEDNLVVDPRKTSGSGIKVILPIKILFNGKPWEIWEKYNGRLPRFHDQDYNRMIKIIAAKCEINKRVTSHTARHSCLTNLAILTGDIFKLMAVGGILKTDTAMIYIHMAEHIRSGEYFDGIKWK